MTGSAFGNNGFFSRGAFVSLALLGLVSSAKSDELFQPTWAFDHFTYEKIHMKLDNFSGAGFQSKNKYPCHSHSKQ
ncbi:hypothetical protein ACFX2I_001869 [Malus domestica]